MRQELTAETLKNENLCADYALLKLDLNKLESFRIKSENLERELAEFRSNKMQRLNEYESSNRKYSESSDKHDYEIKILHSQVTNLVSSNFY